MNAKYISKNELSALVADLTGAGTRVVAPAIIGPGRESSAYRVIKNASELQAEPLMPARSLKEFFLPPTEPLLRYKQKKGDVEVENAPANYEPTVILGARPCDTAALTILDRVMDWDYHDGPWFGHREATTIINLACSGQDKSCFCTTLELAPDASKGADLLMIPAGEGYVVEPVTGKGEKLIADHAKHFTEPANLDAAAAFREAALKKIEANLSVDSNALQSWLKSHFDEEYWNGIAMRCHGCGACASICPTCHCFDIVDEWEGIDSGVRRRNWDTCQTPKFTIHASGHNPRNDQNARIRQRVMHKFFIYPERFGQVLCTGCGRCARACPAGMDLPEILTQIMSKASGAAERGAS